MSDFPTVFVGLPYGIHVMTPEQIKERARLNEENTASFIRSRALAAVNGKIHSGSHWPRTAKDLPL